MKVYRAKTKNSWSINKLRKGIFLLIIIAAIPLMIFLSLQQQDIRQHAAENRLLLGTSIDQYQLNSQPANIIKQYNFKWITPENDMKMDTIGGCNNSYNYSKADGILTFAQSNNLLMHGHTLVWHNQTSPCASSFTQQQFIDYIKNVMTHYCGRISSIDVVNEALEEDGTYRTSSIWYQKFGPSYIETAFRAAREACPSTKLYYNDYGTEGGAKFSGMMNLIVKPLIQKGLIDGVGFQTHVLASKGLGDLGNSMSQVTNLGVDVAISEMDVRIEKGYPNITAKVLTNQANVYKQAAALCALNTRCARFTVWGTYDSVSWLNSQYNDAPLLFDLNYQPKPAWYAVRDTLFPLLPLPTSTVAYTFRDVVPGSAGFTEVEKLVLKRTQPPDSSGISGCYGPDSSGRPAFCPDNIINRGEMSKFMIIAMRQSVSASGSTFSDVTTTNGWGGFIKYIMRMKELGITLGCNTGTTYCPGDPVTRAAMVTFIGRGFSDFASYTPPTTPSFTDVPTTHPNYKAIEYAKMKGITQGMPGGCPPATGNTFCPGLNVTRIQMAIFLIRAWPN